jgi:hypothetical protein
VTMAPNGGVVLEGPHQPCGGDWSPGDSLAEARRPRGWRSMQVGLPAKLVGLRALSAAFDGTHGCDGEADVLIDRNVPLGRGGGRGCSRASSHDRHSDLGMWPEGSREANHVPLDLPRWRVVPGDMGEIIGVRVWVVVRNWLAVAGAVAFPRRPQCDSRNNGARPLWLWSRRVR